MPLSASWAGVGSSSIVIATSPSAARNGSGMPASARSTSSAKPTWWACRRMRRRAGARRAPRRRFGIETYPRAAMSTFPPPWPANESGQATEPDLETEPSGFVVIVEPGDRIHFLDWGGPATSDQPAVVLIHGLSTNAWLWAPVARRLT